MPDVMSNLDLHRELMQAAKKAVENVKANPVADDHVLPDSTAQTTNQLNQPLK